MDIKKLQTLVIDALEDVKAQDIKVYDTTHLTSLFDRICIASGTSNRQTKALASSVREKVKENGGDVIGVEGEDIGEWVLVDLGDMVVHIMQPVIRGYYRLEELWGDKEVAFGAAKRVSKRSAEVVAEEEPAKRVRSNINQATQTTVDDETKKPAKKARAASVAGDAAEKPKRAARTKAIAAALTSDAAPVAKKPAPRKKAIGTTVKVAATKTAVASAKQAAAKRTTRKAAV
jgi:ribosome-associated protein